MRKAIALPLLAFLFTAVYVCRPVTVQAYDLPYIGDNITISARAEDTLTYLARDYHLGYQELVIANPGVDPWMPDEGTSILIPARHLLPDAQFDGIVVNLAEMRLYAFVDDGLPPLTYPLGIGRDGLETPTGKTHIWQKVENPEWRPTERMREEDPSLPAVVKAGYKNPLGSHALYLGWPQYMIHGTSRPFGIGRRVSSGCMRMYPEDITKLYAITPPGTNVQVVNQPVKAAWIGDQFYVEIHPTMVQANELEQGKNPEVIPLSADEKAYIETRAGDKKDQLDWALIDELAHYRNGVATLVF